MSASLLDRLEQLKEHFDADAGPAVERWLRESLHLRVTAPQELIRLHEAALFFRAYPHNARVASVADRVLFAFGKRIPRPAPEAFEDPTISGIARTGLATSFSHAFALSLAKRHAKSVRIGWDYYEDPERLAGPIANVYSPAREDYAIAPHPDWQRWYEKYEISGGTLAQLIEKTTSEVWDLLEVPLRWELGDSVASRSRARIPKRNHFFHGKLLERKDVSFEQEFRRPRLHAKRLSARASDAILAVITDVSAVRYRELYGFLYPDCKNVFHVDLGRGVDLFFFQVPRKWRLPNREYCAGMYFKNGVPVGYVECMWRNGEMEVGFNLYYTFRHGETAWLYARLLKLFREQYGVDTFFLDPYQIGHENEEAIASGAFWFYYKLGFRPKSRSIALIAQHEVDKIAADKTYRTPERILRKLAEGRLEFTV